MSYSPTQRCSMCGACDCGQYRAGKCPRGNYHIAPPPDSPHCAECDAGDLRVEWHKLRATVAKAETMAAGSERRCANAEIRAELAEKRLAASLRVIRQIVDEGGDRGYAWIRIHGRAFLASLLPEAKP